MKILIINHYFGSPELGMEYRHYYLAKELRELGHEVFIIASKFSHLRQKQPKNVSAFNWTNHCGFPVLWLAGREYSGNGFDRLLNMMDFSFDLWKKSKKIIASFKPDVVYATSPHPFCSYGAARIAKLSKAKFIFETRDLWPLSIIELGSISAKHPLIKLLDHAENYGCQKADKVVSLLPNVHEYMQHRNADKKWAWIPNGIDPTEWKNIASLTSDIQKSIEAIKQRAKPIIGYAGTHGLANALDTLLDAAKLSPQDFEVVLVGNGQERNRLIARIQQEKINNVTCLPAIPKAAIPAFLEEIDIAYIGWHRNPLYRFGISPNKLMDYMMAGKPIVHAVEAGNDPVAEAGCGFTVAPGDANSVRHAILKLTALSHSKRQVMGERGKQFILAKHTYPVLVKHLLEAIRSIG